MQIFAKLYLMESKLNEFEIMNKLGEGSFG
jgi:hypothetical protein